jgi:hypothetical protein
VWDGQQKDIHPRPTNSAGITIIYDLNCQSGNAAAALRAYYEALDIVRFLSRRDTYNMGWPNDLSTIMRITRDNEPGFLGPAR